MKHTKKIEFYVNKPQDYQPITIKENIRIQKLLTKHILTIANHFDGTSRFTIHIVARGNA